MKTLEIKMKLLILYSFMLGMLLSGAANKIFSKMQNSTKSENEKFYHPFFQTFLIFFGESLCLLLYFIYLCIGTKEKEDNKKDKILTIQSENGSKNKGDASIFLYIIPMLVDVVSSTWGFIALNFVEASVTLMLNGLGFLSIVIFSIILLKRKLYRQHWLAVPLILTGITIVGYASMTNDKGKEKKDTKWIGFVFIFFTQLFGSLLYLRKYPLHLNVLYF